MLHSCTVKIKNRDSELSALTTHRGSVIHLCPFNSSFIQLQHFILNCFSFTKNTTVTARSPSAAAVAVGEWHWLTAQLPPTTRKKRLVATQCCCIGFRLPSQPTFCTAQCGWQTDPWRNESRLKEVLGGFPSQANAITASFPFKWKIN